MPNATVDPANPRLSPLLIADADIPTTNLIARALAQGFGEVEKRPVQQLFGAKVEKRPVFVSRLCHPSFGWLLRYFVERNVRYAYFLDDNFWELTEAVDPGLSVFYQHPVVIALLDEFIRQAHVVVVMSRRLGDYIAQRHPGVRIEYVVPGFDVAGVQGLDVSPSSAHPGIVRIGYPTSRRPAIVELLAPVIRDIAKRHAGRVEFDFIGWAPDDVIDLPGVTLHPHIASYDEYLKFMISRAWDIGIAPLAGDPFEAFKTQVKYREYGGCHIAGVYSALPPYTDYVQQGRTGVLVDNTSAAWIDSIETLVADSARRAAIAKAAYADIAAHYDQALTAQQLVTIGTELVARGTWSQAHALRGAHA